MSKIALSGNASGTGVFTFASPNSNTDRTLTLPDATGTILTSGTTVTAAQGGTGLTSPGANGNVLTSDGTNWTSAAPSAGAFTFITTTDLSTNATADFTLPSGYDAYQFVLGNVTPVTDGVNLLLRTSSNGGSSFDAGGGDYRSDAANTSSFQINANTIGNAINEWGVSACVYIFHPHLSAFTFMRSVGTSQNTDGDINNLSRYAARLSTSAVNAVRFLYSSGNLKSGTITLYGMKNA